MKQRHVDDICHSNTALAVAQRRSSMSVDGNDSVTQDRGNNASKDTPRPSPDANRELTEKLDGLLERYLNLLDDYQKARTALTQSLSSVRSLPPVSASFVLQMSLICQTGLPLSRPRKLRLTGEDAVWKGLLRREDAGGAARVRLLNPESWTWESRANLLLRRVTDEKACEIVTFQPDHDAAEHKEKKKGDVVSSASPASGEDGKVDNKLQARTAQAKKQVGGMVIGQADDIDGDDHDEMEQKMNSLQLCKSTNGATQDTQDQPELSAATTPTEERSESTIPKADETVKKKRSDPIHMFGLLVPQALRQAQSAFIEVVELSVPRSIELDVAMKEIEIEIRRTRKFLGKK